MLHGGNESNHSNDSTRPNDICFNGDSNGSNGHTVDMEYEPGGGPAGFPIAIIGMSCRLPGEATNPEKLWELCAQGRDAWSPIPHSRFNSEAFYDRDHERMGTV